ncbi:MAG: hypothetical protein AB1758_17050 [Candidatus Eremiobacterota bacterium]
MNLLQELLGELHREFPGLRIVPHSRSRLTRWVARAVRLLTGTRDFQRTYCVIGNAIYVPDDWLVQDPVGVCIVLRHERIHLRQVRRHGMPWLTFLYLVPFFPLGLAYCRARLEWEAFEETLRATLELRGPQALRSPALRQRILGWFTGPRYGWMWPFPAQVNRWYDRALERLDSEGYR